MAVRIALRVPDDRQLMLQTDQVAQTRDAAPRAEMVAEFVLAVQRDSVPIDMIMNVFFICVRADKKGVLAFEESGRELIADAVCSLRCDLTGLERLANLI